MCGLNGLFGNISYTDKKVFQELLVMSAFRGPHSTGMAFTGAKEDPGFVKMEADPFTFLGDKDVQSVLGKWHNFDAVLGHNRYATRGKVSSDNAHPFMHGHITLTHNGHIDNAMSLYKGYKGFDVDSEHLAYAMSQTPIEQLAKDVKGAFCLAWWDNEKKSFNLLRNEDRPINIVKAKNRNVWYYASEADMLKYALKRSSVEHDTIFSIRPGEMLSWHREKADKLHIKPVTLYTPPYNNARSMGAWLGDDWEQSGGGWQRIDRNQGQQGIKQVGFVHPTTVTPEAATPSDSDAEKARERKLESSRRFERGQKWLREVHGIDTTSGKEYFTLAWMCGFEGTPPRPPNDVPHKTWGRYTGYLYGKTTYGGDAVIVEANGFTKAALLNDKGHIKNGVYKVRICTAYLDGDGLYHIVVATHMTETDDINDTVYLEPPKPKPIPVVERKEEEVAERIVTLDSEDFSYASWVPGPLGVLISPTKFLTLVKDGCSYCGCDIAVSHSRLICWTVGDMREPLCRTCGIDFAKAGTDVQSYTSIKFKNPMMKSLGVVEEKTAIYPYVVDGDDE